MGDQTAIALAAVLVLGLGAQWLAWRIKMPAILLLLLTGLIAGPAIGFLNPDEIFGRDLLLPIVSFSVAIILFEGGLNLHFKDIKELGGTVLSLVTVGMLVSWGVATAGAYFILDLDFKLALLIGGILVVTGPTVIGPLLRQVRPKKKVGNLLKWEGILIDPIGALLAVLVFEALIVGEKDPAIVVWTTLGTTVAVGLGLGLALAAVLVLLLRRFWLPDFLHSPFTLMAVLGSFALSNLIQNESGLLTVTVMGIAMANQKFVKVEHILEFKENLQVLLISSLFILLSSRIEMSTITKVGSQSVLFLLVLVLIGRPLSIFISTIFSNLNFKEKVFLSFLAPRGIVAAAVASVFALELEELGTPGAEMVVPNVFLVIVGTVLVYGLGSGWVARKLELSDNNPQGVFFVGASPFTIAFGKILQEKGYKVLLADTNWENVRKAKQSGLETLHGNVLSEKTLEDADFGGIGKMMAMTPNSEVNSLALAHMTHQFTRERCYQVTSSNTKKSDEVPASMRQRILFGFTWDASSLNEAVQNGSSLKATNLTKEFDFTSFQHKYGNRATVLALMLENGDLQPVTVDYQPKPKPGTVVIALIRPDDENEPISA